MRNIQSVAIDFGKGNLNYGFSNITAQAIAEDNSLLTKFTGSLPPAQSLVEAYRNWQSTYHAFSQRLVMLSSPLEEEDEEPEFNSLTIEQLEEALKTAIARGLKLAIFNSCDGLGLANALEKLHIPQVIVMREPVPNLVAQQFFHHFLIAFAVNKLPLYLAVKQARCRLQGLEQEYPAASWLPIICQNPAVRSPTWLDLGGIPPCPYRGLFAFSEQDAHLFFGREKFVADLSARVYHDSLVAVVGASGSGKSSAVFAGLVPQLRRERHTAWQIVAFRPGNNPIAALVEAFRKAGLVFTVCQKKTWFMTSVLVPMVALLFLWGEILRLNSGTRIIVCVKLLSDTPTAY